MAIGGDKIQKGLQFKTECRQKKELAYQLPRPAKALPQSGVVIRIFLTAPAKKPRYLAIPGDLEGETVPFKARRHIRLSPGRCM